MFINCVCYNSVKPSKQASRRSILGRDMIRGGGKENEKRRQAQAMLYDGR